MHSIRRILVAVREPSASDNAAIAKAAQIARGSGATVELFHALAQPIHVDATLWQNVSLAEIERDLRAKALAKLEACAKPLRKKGIDVVCWVEFDHPRHEAIVRRALRTATDLVVAEIHSGTRRRAPWLLRFTDIELLRLSPVPVLLVKRPDLYRRPRVLMAVDPSHANAKPSGLDRQIVAAGAALTEALRGSLHAVHAFAPVMPVRGGSAVLKPAQYAQVEAKLLEQAQKRFDGVVQDVVTPKRRYLVPKHPIDAIPAAVEKSSASIVVMGAISRSGLKRFLIGNTAEQLFDSLACDLLVVKPLRFKARVAARSRGPLLTTTATIGPGAW